MPAQYDHDFSPPKSALTVWADPRYIYVLLPTKPGAEIPDPILTFPRTARGFSEIVSLIFGKAESAGNVILPGPPRKLVGTAIQHDQAQAILRRHGVIK